MKLFNFANFVPPSPRATVKRRDQGAAKPAVKKPTPAAAQANASRKLREARADGVAAGRMAERSRIAAILVAGGLAGHEAVAMAIATDLSPKAAAARLSPEGQAANILSNAGRELPAELAQAQRRMMAVKGARR